MSQPRKKKEISKEMKSQKNEISKKKRNLKKNEISKKIKSQRKNAISKKIKSKQISKLRNFKTQKTSGSDNASVRQCQGQTMSGSS